MSYQILADVYDAFNEDANYEALFDYIIKQFHCAKITKGIVADLGCGTGDLTLMLAQSGYDMIGVDASEEMLSILQEKRQMIQAEDVLLLQQDLCQLDLYGTVDAAISTFDTFNHIGPYDVFEQALKRCALFLKPDGIFIFDMNTPYKHAYVLANNQFEMEAEDVECTWQNVYHAQSQTTNIEITVQDKEDGSIERECFTEYAYTKQQILQALETAGLAVIDWCDGDNFGVLKEQTQRYLITAKKRRDKNCNREYMPKESEHGQIDTSHF